jgi:septum formation protein
MKNLILASQSPRRKQLLEQAELSFIIKTAHSDEDFPAEMNAEEVPVFIANNKAEAVFQQLGDAEQKDALIIAADTVVILEGKIIGKPVDAEDAKNILQQLSGKIHKVVTGVVLLSGEQNVQITDVTEVHFLPLTATQIEHYVDRYQPLDKAGAYAIQEWIGLVGIRKIDGDFYNVMGLPVSRVVEEIKKMS